MQVGIFAGTFDPVHKGHLAFALAAIDAAGLDKVVFLPEPVPRYKPAVTHVAHRIALLKRALRPHAACEVLELPDRQFSFAASWPRLIARYPADSLSLLIGSDVLGYMPAWRGVETVLPSIGLVVGVRAAAHAHHTEQALAALPTTPRQYHTVQTAYPAASSTQLRAAIAAGKPHAARIRSLDRYIREQWLYTDLSSNS